MSIVSQKIKNKANELGFQKVGITKVELTIDNKSNLDKWISEGFHASMHWIENRKEERANIFNYFPEAVSLISVGMNYFSGTTQDDIKSKYKFSNYAWGEDYHILIKDRLKILLEWINNTSEDIKGVACVDTSPIMEKVWAQKAGLGWQGKHTNLISRDYGSWLFLGEIILNIPLEYDAPFVEDLCGSCTACIDACPTDAITSYQLDSNKCISYRTIEHRGDFNENEKDLDGWIYGCDVCQEVCPWNNKFSKISHEESFFPKAEILDWSEKEWMGLDDKTFKRLFKGSAVKRTKFSGLQRNIKQNSS
ncbi:MAG: tRNA epoxyqueuosine(34) reductase QueG [Candidatus Neomarinimicrobiota bacterium]|nr:tRNA epoxyqueuosine(34) reductase QueG [Candidatus Neomarinimicrobiota bacterium]